MKQLAEGHVLGSARIGGLHVVTLAWDFVEGQNAKRDGLLGFALWRGVRTEERSSSATSCAEIKRFKSKDEGLAPGTPVPTSEHPIQSFQWAVRADAGADVQISSCRCLASRSCSNWMMRLQQRSKSRRKPSKGARNSSETIHDIYFNRGVAGSQAYARKFGDPLPTKTTRSPSK